MTGAVDERRALGAVAEIDRRDFVGRLREAAPDALFVAGLGSPTYDLAAAGDRPSNFYLWGAMGGAASVGLGLAMAQPNRRVIVVTGDGEMLMGIGALATIAAQAPPGLAICVLDNEAFAETGEQSGLTGRGADLAAAAAGLGIGQTMTVRREADAPAALSMLTATPGPAVVVVKSGIETGGLVLAPRDGVAQAWRLRAHLGLPIEG